MPLPTLQRETGLREMWISSHRHGWTFLWPSLLPLISCQQLDSVACRAPPSPHSFRGKDLRVQAHLAIVRWRRSLLPVGDRTPHPPLRRRAYFVNFPDRGNDRYFGVPGEIRFLGRVWCGMPLNRHCRRGGMRLTAILRPPRGSCRHVFPPVAACLQQYRALCFMGDFHVSPGCANKVSRRHASLEERQDVFDSSVFLFLAVLSIS